MTEERTHSMKKASRFLVLSFLCANAVDSYLSTVSVSMQRGMPDMMHAYVPPLSSMRSTPAASRRTANVRESSSSKPPKETNRQ